MVTGNDLQVKVVKLPPPTARPISKTQKVADALKTTNCTLVDTISYVCYTCNKSDIF